MALLKKMLRNRIGLSALSVFVSVISICVSLWWNAQLSGIINLVNMSNTISAQTILLAFATLILSASIAYIHGLGSSWTCETLAHDLRMGFAKHFMALPIAEMENLNAGEQLSKLQNEISDVSGFLRANLFSIVDDLIKFIGTFIWLIWLDPKLVLLSNAPVAILMLYTLNTSKVIGKAAQESQQANAEMTGFTDTVITLFPVLRLFDAMPLFSRKYDDALSKWESATIKEERRKAQLLSPSGLFSYLPLLILFLIGGTQIINGITSIGTLYIFINLSGNVSGVMMNMPGRIAGYRRFSVNMKRLETSVLIEKVRF
jgi:ABC-type multidrug transport system fused ATPase/permease subunit